MRLTLVISSLGAGGAERVMSIMANHWSHLGWLVTLITLGDGDTDFFPLHPGVKRVRLGVMGKSSGLLDAAMRNLRRIRVLRRAIIDSRPEGVVSFMDKVNVLTMLATRWTGVPVVISERVDPRYYSIGPIWVVLRLMLYPFCDALVVQTHAIVKWASSMVGSEKVRVIPNPVPAHDGQPVTSGNAARPFILAAGRLEAQKGFDLLIRAFEPLAARFADWDIVIAGEGSQREALERSIRDEGLAGRVRLVGSVDGIQALMAQAEIFVLSSRYEGFPNVLLEAMALGRCVVSFDCPSGPGEIIRPGHDGLLVAPEDVAALSAAIANLIQNDRLRGQLAVAARAGAERFRIDTVMAQWTDVLGAARACQ